MSRPVRTEEAEEALRAIITERVQRAAGDAAWLTNAQAKALHRHLVSSERALRVTGGDDVAVRVEALIERAVAEALEVWERHNPQDVPRDRVWLSLDELRAIERDDEAVGELSRAAHARAKAAHGDDPVAAARSFFEAYDFEGRSFPLESLPEGGRVDARPGREERALVPEAALQAFDTYHQVEAAGRGSASLHRGRVGQFEVWATFLHAEGDLSWLEVFDADGAPLAGARLFGSVIQAWDHFDGRARLSREITTVDGVEWEEGYSEADERERFGQPPRDWTGDFIVSEGALYGDDRTLSRVDFGALNPTPMQRELAVAAFDFLWNAHLKHRRWGDRPVELGDRRNGVLIIGDRVKHTRGRSYATCWWRDIDDGSFVLYFDRSALGLKLAISQFDN